MERLIARWRETGRWWEGEPEREFARFLDNDNIVRESVREHTCVIQPKRLMVKEDVTFEVARTVDYEVIKRETRDSRLELERINTLKALPGSSSYVPLHCVSAYSFGRSSLTPERIVAKAYLGGMQSVAMADRFSLSGSHAFCSAARDIGIKPIIGASIEMESGGELVLLAMSADGYINLSRLITRCHLDEPRQHPLCNWDRLAEYSDGLVCLTGGHYGPINIALIGRQRPAARDAILRLRKIFGTERLYVEIERSMAHWELSVNIALLEIASDFGLRAIAGGTIAHEHKDTFAAQDALLCAETLCTVEEIIGRKPQRHADQPPIKPLPLRWMNAERRFRDGKEFEALFRDHPELITNAKQIASDAPDWPLPNRPPFPSFEDAPECILRNVVYDGAARRYFHMTPKVRKRIDMELKRICDLGFASHFLAMWEACRWAKSRSILYSARGSVVDSAAAYCLGLSRIDAIEHDLHFDRFLPGDGSKRPDIDIDFEASRRNDVREFFVRRYGREHVAGVAAIATYQGRGIVRMIGKAMMLPESVIDLLAKRMHGSVTGRNIEAALLTRPELRDSGIPKERFLLLFEIARQVDGLPRGIAAHSSGLVLSSVPICDTVPVMNSALGDAPIIQWDKYSSKHYFDKFDILCLRGQDVLAGTQQRVRLNSGADLNVERIPLDDEMTFEAFRQGNLIGIPQSASPAMRQAHMRLRTRNLHDASLVQAGIRPGVGGAVKINALIRRRRGLENYAYPHPLLEEILGMSYGIIVFQEQVDQLLQGFAGYTSGEAEEIREKIHKLRANDWGDTIHDVLIERILSRGFSNEVAEHVFDLVSGFRGYGFAQGHALSFAEISIRCTYLQNNYPSEYFASLLTSQPAGYYGPGTIANEARIRGVRILPIDINSSDEIFTASDRAIRVGLMQLHGLSAPTAQRIAGNRPYRSIFDFCARAKPNAEELEFLILSGAFDTLHSNRRALLWVLPEAIKLAHVSTPGNVLFEDEPVGVVPENISDFSAYEKAVLERAMLGMDIKEHLMSFERDRIRGKGGITCADAAVLMPGKKVVVCGLAMRLRFPPTASGRRVVFFDLEDETSLLNVTCFDETYQRDGHAIICSPFVTLIGTSQERDGHPAFLAHRVFPYRLSAEAATFAQERRAVHAEDFIIRKGR